MKKKSLKSLPVLKQCLQTHGSLPGIYRPACELQTDPVLSVTAEKNAHFAFL